MMKKKLGATVATVLLGVSAIPFNVSAHEEVTTEEVQIQHGENNQEHHEEQIGQMTLVNEHTGVLNFNEGITHAFNGDGTVTLTDSQGNSEVLPQETVDKNGENVRLVYEEAQNGQLAVTAVLPQENGRQKRSAGKCLAGIGAGAFTTGTSLGIKGAGAGTVAVPGVGTVGLGVVGAVGGAIGGGLGGAAASCF
ncbi:hypothetical protein B8A44_04625 [Dolosigranulum pigrum]|jgi:hypothetical protein|uniref:Pathogenicity island protein n=1 Tax=Dolosigranulum pigrum TaxID=29394 RepID=A0A1S8KPL8_9LACT|nr:hypothetical protein [Dolosigranulum pigrum]OOL81684.1 hypothetical protein BWX42_08255 [Dolosigranulum pigrum]QTJ35555.1 hypothetical protein FE323_00515 [Dolosigranulum pigrum]QTJ45221.1 hypothetical protein FE328_06630 [Dolosigranulum pigrum]QTJ57012.1 hypothetical protein FE335_05620 [Dolosigranulum pigrum]RAN52473.1 hypothetical protein B8A39_04780 [Dolosigranulum pigrum]